MALYSDPNSRRLAFTALALLLALSACNKPAEPVSVVHEYDWLTRGEPSGSLRVEVLPDGQRLAAFEFNDRGRGPKLSEKFSLDERGLLIVYEVTGSAYLGSPVDERFDQKTTDTPDAFYLPAEGTPESSAALTRALLKSPNHSLALLRAGEAHVEAVSAQTVNNGTEDKSVTLYSVTGLGFEPEYLWLDDQQELFAVVSGWMGLTPKGWITVYPALEETQNAVRDQHFLDQAKALTHPMAGAYCISDVAVLDVEAGLLNPDLNVRVENGLIAAISPDQELACQDAVVIAGGGRTLMPGLFDMHSHLSALDGILNIANGITGARDLGNNDEQLVPLMAQFDSGEVIGPQVWAAGFIDAKSPFTAPIQAPAESLDDALASIERFAAEGRAQVKIYSSIDPAWVKPMAEAIHGHGMRLSGHIPSGMTAEQAVLAGFDEIQHVNMLFLNFLAKPEDDTRTPLRFTLVAEGGGSLDLDSPEVTEFIELLSSRGIEIDSTVSIFRNMFLQKPGEVPEAFITVAGHFPPTVLRSLKSGGMDITDENAGRYAASADALLHMVLKLYEAGVPLLAGTDDMPGFTLHSELERYVQAGIPNAAVLRIVTQGAAEVLGVNDRYGRIAPGYVADMTLIDGDPLTNISAVRNTALVARGQRLYQPAALFEAIGIQPFVPPVELWGQSKGTE